MADCYRILTILMCSYLLTLISAMLGYNEFINSNDKIIYVSNEKLTELESGQ